ncbi:MAG: hypothetical protein B6D72_08220 [gamma proteobacterium symbiont of Ctena orbiculata]|nr:MAG: hypothetical protein B6D72_08220 [gamma proteobacterium symbiont of Ctena orbiculata]PVV16394.1 MAG: hypothetical protein B6D82_01115 [gamma proteobacterium symbiont of Ctena orbiculata]PVV23486.1 MAG: hypothetical protein B6D74_07615 [gamma proteobacterium symbiont of Ctena orbiculata]
MIHATPIFWMFSILLAISSTLAVSDDKGMPANKGGAIAHTATVLETMSTAGYTYIRVEEEGKAFWIALPQTQIGVGDKISFYEQMLMENFTSPSLNRTFDRILFVEAISKGAELPTKVHAKPSPNKEQPKPQAVSNRVTGLGSPFGRFTIKEIFEKKDELGGKVIEVKGKIAKLSMQIMGSDWVHIEDGTGAAAEKNNKIVMRTTQGGIAVGDEVTAKGVLYVNKDFGYGYFYPVIIEDAVFSK